MPLNCPCETGSPYSACCQPYHKGVLAENALKLMRSRYSAYALHLPDYIIKTTHHRNPAFTSDQNRWREEILNWCCFVTLESLAILEFIDREKEAWVTFHATIKQGENDLSFTEKSFFLKEKGIWLYVNGEFNDSINGKIPRKGAEEKNS